MPILFPSKKIPSNRRDKTNRQVRKIKVKLFIAIKSSKERGINSSNGNQGKLMWKTVFDFGH